jgi:uncharacterized membrane protein YsdA (DUF1294 family)/cold shock CspA family protein
MRSQRAPRYQGRITSWKDDAGFGFITPNGGGLAVFVHIKSFASLRTRPELNDIVTYHLSANEAGKPRAEQVAFVGDPAPAPSAAPPSGARSVITAIAFLVLVGILALLGKMPPLLFGVYAGMSVFTFVAYAFDKSAARRKGQRIPENNLQLFAFLGGWPGALLAQQILRHKSKKQSFRTGLWWMVALNCLALLWLLSPQGARIVGAVRGLPV